MNTIKRTFKIISRKSATQKALREVGFSISGGDTVFTTNNFSEYQGQVVAQLCKAGQLKMVEKSFFWMLDTVQQNPEKYYKGWLKDAFAAITAKRNRYALGIARSYHTNIKSLYTSYRADVMVQSGVFNPALLENKDWNAYAKNYGRPAVWKDAAVVIVGKTFDIYTSRGTKVASYKLPKMQEIDRTRFDGLIGNDLYCKEIRKNIFVRYDKKERPVGYAVRLKHPETGKLYFEHGKTITEVKQEYKHKQDVAAEKQRLMQIAALKRQEQQRINRAKNLIMRMVKNATVTFSDARSVGYCVAGIKGFCERNGVQFSEQAQVPYGFLKRFPETQRLRETMAERMAIQLFTRG